MRLSQKERAYVLYCTFMQSFVTKCTLKLLHIYDLMHFFSYSKFHQATKSSQTFPSWWLTRWLTSSRVGMIFSRISPIVSMLAFTLRILSGTILAKRKQGIISSTRSTRHKAKTWQNMWEAVQQTQTNLRNVSNLEKENLWLLHYMHNYNFSPTLDWLSKQPTCTQSNTFKVREALGGWAASERLKLTWDWPHRVWGRGCERKERERSSITIPPPASWGKGT